MSVDIETVRRVARLARIAVTEEEAERMTGELNRILGFVEQLNEVDVSGVEPMTSVIPMEMKKRAGRRHRRRQAGRHRRQRAGDGREFLPRAEGGRIAAMADRDRGRDAAAGRRARAGGGAERLSARADAARIPVPADRRADGRARRSPSSSRATRGRAVGMRRAEGSWRRAGRGEAHVHAAGGARPADRRADIASGSRAWRARRALTGWCWKPARRQVRAGLTASTSAAGSRVAARCSTIPIPAVPVFYEKKLRLMTDLTRLTIAEAREKLRAKEITVGRADRRLSRGDRARPTRCSTPISS